MDHPSRRRLVSVPALAGFFSFPSNFFEAPSDNQLKKENSACGNMPQGVMKDV